MLPVAEAALGTAYQLSPVPLDLIAGRAGKTGNRRGLPVEAPEIWLRALRAQPPPRTACRPCTRARANFIVYLEDRLSARGKRDAVGQLLRMQYCTSSGRATDNVDAFPCAPGGIQLRGILIVSEGDCPGPPAEEAERGDAPRPHPDRGNREPALSSSAMLRAPVSHPVSRKRQATATPSSPPHARSTNDAPLALLDELNNVSHFLDRHQTTILLDPGHSL